MAKTPKGFTIVELLIVIVVIGILAAITIVAYNDIQKRSRTASLQSNLSSAAKVLAISNVTNGKYPTDLTHTDLEESSDTTYAYTYDETNNSYCLSATSSTISRYITNLSSNSQSGTCATVHDLIGWWPFNEGADDVSGNNNTGTINGAVSLVDGQNGRAQGAYNLNGGYIAISGFSSDIMRTSSFGSSWSLSVWAKWGGTFTNEGILIGRQGCNGGIYEYANKYAFAIKGSGCWTGAQTIYGSSLDNNWHLLTATYHAGAMAFYEDGALQGTATLSDIYNYGSGFGIGSGSTSSYTFIGSLDDARVYARALSASEVLDLYRAGAR